MKKKMCYEFEIGTIYIAADGDYITDIRLSDDGLQNVEISETAVIKNAAKQLEEYFAGVRKVFDMQIKFGGTPFQQQVWRALMDIGYGETRSYKDVAVEIGNEKACRAVGSANNRNRVWIVVPCHRVIGANGSLVGYGGGLTVKERLLQLEKTYNM